MIRKIAIIGCSITTLVAAREAASQNFEKNSSTVVIVDEQPIIFESNLKLVLDKYTISNITVWELNNPCTAVSKMAYYPDMETDDVATRFDYIPP